MVGPILLKRWRAQSGLTQTKAAGLIGVRQAHYSEWENGRKSPQVRFALKIAKVSGGAVPVIAWADDEDVDAKLPPARVA